LEVPAIANPIFEYSGLELEVMSVAKNYRNYWMSKVPSVPRDSCVLEVGAGIGSNVNQLLELFSRINLIEPDKNQEIILREKFRRQLKSGSIKIYSGYEQIPQTDKYDLILYIDVLEHIEDDSAEIKLASLRLKENGYLFVVVPAFQALFSEYDRKLSHYRRYDRKKLIALISTNLEIKSLFFIDSIGLIGVSLNRILHNTNLSRTAVKIWDGLLVPFSVILDRFIVKHRFGKSLILVARKR
jgi:hypothetical protein